MPEKAIFLDRDGTVNIRTVGDYILQYKDFHFCEDFPFFFRYIKSKGYLAVLITNQQCVGKKMILPAELEEIHSQMQQDLRRLTGYCFDGIYWCGDLRESNSFRRKPNPGMIFEAVQDFDIDKYGSFMIGDSETDIATGVNAGVRTILIGNAESEITPNFRYLNFKELELAEII